jgi:uncharacterized repeat protein (TIGR01451 family)
LFAAFLSLALLPCGVALADTYTANSFAGPAFKPGSIAGQDGWTAHTSGISPSNGGFDQEIVATSQFYKPAPKGFGAQAFRISNAYASGIQDGQTMSARVQDAGEGQPNSEFIAQFSFITTTPNYQKGLYLTISPGNGVGGRIAWVSLEDMPDGTLVRVADSPGVDGDFVYYPVAVLPRGVPHTIKLWIKFNSGPNNDLMRISIDGHDAGQCYTTWENYLLANPDGATGGVLVSTNSLMFRLSRAALAVLGGGYLFGNVALTSDNGPGPPGCDVPIVKSADSPTVTAGGLAGYRITVRNRGRLAARNLLVCDHIPRHMTFVSANRKLRDLGNRRCLSIPRLRPGRSSSLHVMLRVDANAPPGIELNTADVGPVVPLDLSPPISTHPGLTPPDLPAPAVSAPAFKALVVRKVRAIIKVLAARVSPPPAVTG